MAPALDLGLTRAVCGVEGRVAFEDGGGVLGERGRGEHPLDELTSAARDRGGFVGAMSSPLFGRDGSSAANVGSSPHL